MLKITKYKMRLKICKFLPLTLRSLLLDLTFFFYILQYRTCRLWKTLPLETRQLCEEEGLSELKTSLTEFITNYFNEHFYCDIKCSWCLKCSCNACKTVLLNSTLYSTQDTLTEFPMPFQSYAALYIIQTTLIKLIATGGVLSKQAYPSLLHLPHSIFYTRFMISIFL